MAVNIDFINKAKEAFAKLSLSEIEIDPALKNIEVEGGSIKIEVYKTDKIEKIVFCFINIFDSGVIETTAMAWPDNTYDFPALWCNLTIVPSVMNVPVFDFIPLADIVIHPEYAEKNIEGLIELKANAMEVFNDTILDKAVDLPSKSVYTLSPYKLVTMVSEEGIPRVSGVATEYINAYILLINNASPVKDPSHSLRKKAAARKLMKANDPGYPFMVDVFGEERTRKVFDIIF